MPSFENSWLPFLYLYLVGGFFFFLGIIIIRKSGSLNMKLQRHKRWFRILIFGYFYFILIHATLIIAAIYW